ncbi:MAG TPA: hypothetical protein VFQ61_11590 [Polyangiaceae bacterium]|nr:hypothetical protein [Polyangiaceae bacterium]
MAKRKELGVDCRTVRNPTERVVGVAAQELGLEPTRGGPMQPQEQASTSLPQATALPQPMALPHAKVLPQAGSSPGASAEPLEELGDDAIIAQQTVAELPKREQINEEARSVVISDLPPPRSGQRAQRGRGDPTIVIRDRRELDAARQRFLEEHRRSQEQEKAHQAAQKSRSMYYVMGLGLLAFAIGGGVALAKSRHQRAVTQQRIATQRELQASRAAAARRATAVIAPRAPGQANPASGASAAEASDSPAAEEREAAPNRVPRGQP